MISLSSTLRTWGRMGTCPLPAVDAGALRASVRVPELPDLTSWLQERERRVPGLRPGVEAGIVWAGSAPQKTPLSFVYLPGYTATRGELAPVPELLARRHGANLFYARLTGHGARPEDHRDVAVTDWLRDGIEALEIGTRLGERVVILATSTGGTLASWLVLGPLRANPAAVLLVSPNLGPQNKMSRYLLWPGNELLLRLVVGDEVSVPADNELNERYWDLTHHSHSLIPMMQLVSLARRQDFRAWPCPLLAVYDPQDTVVDEKVTERLLSRVPGGRAELVRWETLPGDQRHVLAGDAVSPGGTRRMVELCGNFLDRVFGDTAVP